LGTSKVRANRRREETVELKLADPGDLGLDPLRVQRLRARLDAAIEAGEAPGVSLAVARDGRVVSMCAGRTGPEHEAPPVNPETVFLVASVTKPVVVTAAMLLVERGQLALDRPVADVLPEFAEGGKEAVTVRHLMTHTSGLPDMLPENQELREQHAPLDEFVRRVCRLKTDFVPGTRIQYQSMGIAALGAVVEQADGRPLPVILDEGIFQPLRMVDSSLGLKENLAERLVRSDLSIPGRGSTIGACDTDWGWNSSYWHRFGAPWGGMFATPLDLCRFLRMFVDAGTKSEQRILSPATVTTMTRCHTDEMPDLSESERRHQGWGLGWKLARSPTHYPFGDLVSPTTYGHQGDTGTVVWNDPATGLSAAIFCNRPIAQTRWLLHQCSSLIAAAGL